MKINKYQVIFFDDLYDKIEAESPKKALMIVAKRNNKKIVRMESATNQRFHAATRNLSAKNKAINYYFLKIKDIVEEAPFI